MTETATEPLWVQQGYVHYAQLYRCTACGGPGMPVVDDVGHFDVDHATGCPMADRPPGADKAAHALVRKELARRISGVYGRDEHPHVLVPVHHEQENR